MNKMTMVAPLVRCGIGRRWQGVLLLIGGVFAFQTAWSDDLATSPLTDGVALHVGSNDVDLEAPTPQVFLLRIAAAGQPIHAPSIFLSDKAPPKALFTITHAGAITGIKTASGELLVDTVNQKWTLHDAAGATITDWASLPSIGTAAGSAFDFEIGSSPNQPHPLYYGSGNNPILGALTQTEAQSRTENGSTSMPQFWSTALYGALVITDNDNKPAAWKANDKGGVDWKVTGLSADLYLAPAVDLYAWLQADAQLTGFAPIPPRWSFGYLQSRWGWKDKAYIDDTLAHFRRDSLPVDAFIIDFEWYTKTPDYTVKAPGDPNFVDFDWNPSLFPDPANQLANFAGQGLQIIGIRKPRIGNSENLKLARSKGWILPDNPDDPNSADIRTRNLDFSNPDVQAWYQENNRKFVEAGMAGFWDDEGETNYSEYNYWNLTQATLFKEVDPNARFWSLNRSFAPGLQRFGAAAWTGDINADWGTLAATPGQLLSDGLSGMPYCTCDIGGFNGNPTPDLLVRWIEAGVFFPIQRSHSSVDSTAHFPWLFGPEAEAAIRKALDLRYRLVPYFYSLAYETNQTGAPLMRPLKMEFPADDKVSGLNDEWLMGRGLLAAPVLQQAAGRDVYLPDDQWFSFGTNQMLQGPQTLHLTTKLDEIPLYVRAGTLLPLGPVLQSTSETTTAPLELQIYPGHNGSFQFFEDDGKTLGYQKGAVRLTAFSWNDQTKTLNWTITGGYDGANRFRNLTVVLFSPQGPVSKDAALDNAGAMSFP